MKHLPLLMTALAIAACAQERPVLLQPPWLQLKIAEFQKLPPFQPPRAILQAAYQGKTVYYVSPACCDIPSELYDQGGTLLCFPDGGFAGGDGRCPAFKLTGSGVSTVWRDERSAAPRPRSAPKPEKK